MKQTVELSLEVKGIEEAMEKAEKLVKALKKTKILADESASTELDIALKEN